MPWVCAKLPSPRSSSTWLQLPSCILSPASLNLHDAFSSILLFRVLHFQRKHFFFRLLLRLRDPRSLQIYPVLVLDYVWCAPAPSPLSASHRTELTLPSAARSSILSLLGSAISEGYLEIEDYDETFRFGQRKGAQNAVHLKVLSGKFWTRVFRCVRARSPQAVPEPGALPSDVR